MIFTELPIPGAFLVEPEPKEDERGFFARVWCAREFGERGLASGVVECDVSFNRRRGTLRGLHYQEAPFAQAKLVRVTRGAIFDVIVDVRPESATYCRWLSVELSADRATMLYVPEGFAHGFQTLVDDTELFYQMSRYHAPEAERGIRWDDRSLGIAWPPAERIISARDRAYPDFVPAPRAGRSASGPP